MKSFSLQTLKKRHLIIPEMFYMVLENGGDNVGKKWYF